jgi:hypothetical protein
MVIKRKRKFFLQKKEKKKICFILVGWAVSLLHGLCGEAVNLNILDQKILLLTPIKPIEFPKNTLDLFKTFLSVTHLFKI